MCCRYYIERDVPELADLFSAVSRSSLTSKFINTHSRPLVTFGEVRPTDIVPVIAPNSKGERSAFPMQWGFSTGDKKRDLLNARIETAATKPTFREAWKSHRCIVPASYYIEWEHTKGLDGKIHTGKKCAIQPAGSTVTWLCGLYRIEDGFPSFVILTKEPTEELSRIHDRMPLILPESKINEWINPETNPEKIAMEAVNEMVIEALG